MKSRESTHGASAAWLDLARRRLVELHSGTVEAVPGEQVFAQIRKCYDAAWAREAQDRLAAYRRGELPAVGEDEVFGDLGGE